VGLLDSPRRRRRAGWLGIALGITGLVVLGVLLIPNTSGKLPEKFSNTPVQTVVNQKQVPVTPTMRREVDALFDAFVRDAVARRDTGAAYDLATTEFHADGTRAAWEAGELPVYPYEPKGRTFHGWHVETSYPNDLNVQLYLEPAKAGVGPIAFDVELLHRKGRWLINSFYPRTSYAPTEPAKGTAGNGGGGSEEPAVASTLPKAHAGVFWAFMGGFFALILIVPLVFFGVQWFANRKARRSIYDA
jgi:hypothetical protein